MHLRYLAVAPYWPFTTATGVDVKAANWGLKVVVDFVRVKTLWRPTIRVVTDVISFSCNKAKASFPRLSRTKKASAVNMLDTESVDYSFKTRDDRDVEPTSIPATRPEIHIVIEQSTSFGIFGDF